MSRLYFAASHVPLVALVPAVCRFLRATSARTCAILAISTITATALPTTLRAQENEPEPRWAAQIDFGFNGSTGNTRLAVLSTGFQVKHLLTDEFRLEWAGLFRYGESERVVVARNIRSTLNFDLYPLATVSPFVFGTAERDPFRRLRVRFDGGGGAKLTLQHGRDRELSISGAVLYSHESFVRSGDTPTPARNDARLSFRGRVRRRLTEGIRAEHIIFYQPVWDRLGDYNLDSTTRLTAQINDRLGIGLIHSYRHDSTPPPEVFRADQSLQANLTIQF